MSDVDEIINCKNINDLMRKRIELTKKSTDLHIALAELQSKQNPKSLDVVKKKGELTMNKALLDVALDRIQVVKRESLENVNYQSKVNQNIHKVLKEKYSSELYQEIFREALKIVK